MTFKIATLDNQKALRNQAEALIQSGSAPSSRSTGIGLNALHLLNDMASASANASTALKLLHEFQVHQVEIDLQHQQLEQSRAELERALERYVERFDFAPIAYLSLNRDGRIVEANIAAATLFGVERDALSDRRIDNLVQAQCRLPVLAVVKRLNNGSARETCEATIDAGGSVTQQVQIVATKSPSGSYLMMILMTAPTLETD